MLGLSVLWACAGGPGEPLCTAPGLEGSEATLHDTPVVVSPSPDSTPLAWLFEASGSGPLCATVTLDDGTGAREVHTGPATASIQLPLLGLRADETVEVDWVLTDTRDEIIDEGSTTFDTPPLPTRFPRFEVLAHDPSRQAPGHLLLDVKTPETDVPDGEDPVPVAAYVVVLDEDFEVIWWFDAGDKVGDLAVGPDGLLWGLLNSNVYRWSWFGEVQDIWRSNPDATSPVAVDAKDFHHEIIPESDGSFWALSYQVTTVEAYPQNYGSPEVLGPATDIEDSLALRVQPDGTLEHRWAMSDVLDTTRIGYGSLDRIIALAAALYVTVNLTVPAPLSRWADHADRAAFTTAVCDAIQGAGAEAVVLAGFMRILSAEAVERFPLRILNIHPALLPLYPGLNTHERVLEAGDEHHGSTVHFVTEELDGGPRILQGRIRVAPTTDPAELMGRVQAVEHQIYPLAAHWFGEGRLEFRDGATWFDGGRLDEPVIRDFD